MALRTEIPHNARRANGEAVAGAQAYIYYRGTAVQVPVWTSAADGAGLLTQPLIADSVGQFAGHFAPGRYDVVITQDGVTHPPVEWDCSPPRLIGPIQPGVDTSAAGLVTLSSGLTANIATGDAVVQDTNGNLVGVGISTTQRTLGAHHATLPRVDQIVLDAGGQTAVLAGTATAGAQITSVTGANYRAGAASLPAGYIRLADILVPATSGAITIVDRRPRARGFNHMVNSAEAFPGSAAQASGISVIASRTFECSGAPVEISFTATVQRDSNTNSSIITSRPTLDGGSFASPDGIDTYVYNPDVGWNQLLASAWVVHPSAGRRVLGVSVAGGHNAGILYVGYYKAHWRELLQPEAENA